jgi:hypothetical protein
MFRIKFEKSRSKLFLRIINAIRTSDPETGDLALTGLITLSPPKLLKRDERIFAIYDKREKTILSSCYQILSQEVNKRLSGNCIGGRKGFSRHSFMDFLNRAKEQKLNWVVITDVKSFFASISHENLWKILKERFRIPTDVRKLLMELISLGAPSCEPKGIFPGNPLGKLLGNVYLSGLDDFLTKKDLLFTRYIDDIAVFVKTKEEAEQILGDIREYLRENLRMEVAENKTGIYHKYFNRFEFLGFSIIGENIGPSEENVKRFEQRVRNLPDEYKHKGLKKFLRRMNSVVYNFGHMYKKGNVRKVYSKLDEVVRASIRRYLKLSGKGELVNTMYSSPLKFPCNLAFSKEVLKRMGFVNLVQIKDKFERKDQKCELKNAGETSAKDFIQKGNRVNAEKIQIRVGDKVIISITGSVGIGTTGPSQKLEVVGNVSSTGLCLAGTCNTSWPASAVTSVFGRTGAVVAASGDYTTTLVTEGTNLYFTNARAQAAITGGASTIVTSNLTANRALISDASGKVAVSTVTNTELGYVSGVTSAIQTQLNAKAPTASPTFTGNVTMPGTGIWNSSGNVGIGLSSPTSRLHVQGGDFRVDNASNNAALFVQQSTGNVGLGTTGPVNKLDVAGTGDFTTSLSVGTTIQSGALNVLGNANISGNLTVSGTISSGGGPADGARVYNNASENITGGIYTPLTFNSERYDQASYHDTIFDTSRLTAPRTGKYMITGHGDINTGTIRTLQIRLNGATYIAATSFTVGDNAPQSVSTLYHLNSGDYVELIAYSSSQATVGYYPNMSPEFAIEYLGP